MTCPNRAIRAVEPALTSIQSQYTQGWLISTGDLASGVWCFVIGLHTFASVVLDYRVSNRCFYICIVALWVYIYGISLIGVGMYGKELYVRSGIWVSSSRPLVQG